MDDFCFEDAALLSENELLAFLMTHGIQDLEGQPRDMLVEIANAIKVSVTDNKASHFTEEQVEKQHEQEEQREKHLERHATEAAMETEEENMYRMQLVAEFCDATGLEDFEEARSHLKAVNWNVSSAIASFYESIDIQNDVIASTQAANESAAAAQPSQLPTENVPFSLAPPTYTQYHYSDDDEDDVDNYGEEISPQLVRDEYDEDGYRKADPVRRRRLVDNFSHRRMFPEPLGRAEDESVTWLHEPPRHLSFPGNYNEAKALAKDENKWLLVNIQSHTEFASQLLNRDTWSNDMVESIIRSMFVFWSRGHTSDEGRGFMQLYKITEDMLPGIFIVYPRTGSVVLKLKGFVSPEELLTILMDFSSSHDIDNLSSIKLKVIDATTRDPVGEANASSLAMHDSDDLLLPSENSTVVMEDEKVKEDAIPSYGAPSDEPAADADNVVKISFKPATGAKPIIRRFHATETVKSLYAYLWFTIPEAQTRPFDLLASFPTRNLSAFMDQTLQEANLGGAQLIMRWK